MSRQHLQSAEWRLKAYTTLLYERVLLKFLQTSKRSTLCTPNKKYSPNSFRTLAASGKCIEILKYPRLLRLLLFIPATFSFYIFCSVQTDNITILGIYLNVLKRVNPFTHPPTTNEGVCVSKRVFQTRKKKFRSDGLEGTNKQRNTGIASDKVISFIIACFSYPFLLHLLQTRSVSLILSLFLCRWWKSSNGAC